MLSLKIINTDAQLNSFQGIGSFRFIAGADATVVMQIVDSYKNLRYIPETGATFSLELTKSDSTTYVKTPTYKFDPDDRSIITFNITAGESSEIISQDLKLVITEGLITKIAYLQQGLSKVSPGGSC